eukprot:764091-Hanusia_phi.AAC.19
MKRAVLAAVALVATAEPRSGLQLQPVSSQLQKLRSEVSVQASSSESADASWSSQAGPSDWGIRKNRISHFHGLVRSQKGAKKLETTGASLGDSEKIKEQNAKMRAMGMPADDDVGLLSCASSV